MRPRDWLPRARSLAALGMSGGILWSAAICAALALALAFVLHHSGPNADQVVLRRAARETAARREARTAAARAVDVAKANARTAERDARAAVSRAAAARARADMPPPAVERMHLDSAAVAALSTLVRLKDTVIVMQDRRITADSLDLVATSHAFQALQRVKEPRCGRRCGIAIGIGGMLATAIAVGQVRRALR